MFILHNVTIHSNLLYYACLHLGILKLCSYREVCSHLQEKSNTDSSYSKVFYFHPYVDQRMMQPLDAQWPLRSIESESCDRDSELCMQAGIRCWEKLWEMGEFTPLWNLMYMTLKLKASLKISHLRSVLHCLPTGEVTGFVDWAGDAGSGSEEAISTFQSHKENL